MLYPKPFLGDLVLSFHDSSSMMQKMTLQAHNSSQAPLVEPAVSLQFFSKSWTPPTWKMLNFADIPSNGPIMDGELLW